MNHRLQNPLTNVHGNNRSLSGSPVSCNERRPVAVLPFITQGTIRTAVRPAPGQALHQRLAAGPEPDRPCAGRH